MSDIRLKSCPFCGGDAKMVHYYPPFGGRMKTKVRCTLCRCNSGEWGRSDKAIEAWNRRVSE